MPVVSVVIPSYQHASALGACLDSLLAQTYKDLQVTIVDDGSTDNTRAVAESYASKGVRYIYQANQGANQARNTGWKAATGKYLLFCDADVLLDPSRIEKMVAVMEQDSKVHFVYCDFYFGWKFFKGMPFNQDALKDTNYIHTSSLVRASAFPGFDPGVKRLQDWDVWLTMAENGSKGYYLPETLLNVRIEGESRIGSAWLPKYIYRLPWKFLPFKMKRVERYLSAKEALKAKHDL